MSILHKQSPFANVGTGKLALLSLLDMGETCDRIQLKFTGTAFDVDTHVEEIYIELGGKTICDVTAAKINTFNKYMKRGVSATFLNIHFADPNAKTLLGEMIGGIDTSLGYSGFSMKVKFAATAPADSTVEAWMQKSAPKPAKIGARPNAHKFMFRAYLATQENFTAAGKFPLTVPQGSDLGNLIGRVHFFSANMNELEVKKNGLELQGDGERSVVQFNQGELNRTVQAGHFCYDPLVSNDQSNAIATVRKGGRKANMQFRGTFSAAELIETVTEVYTTIDRI